MRLSRRRSKRAIALGALVALCAIGLAALTTHVHARAELWLDQLPTRMFARVMPWNFGDRAMRSLQHRLEDGLDAEEGQQVLVGTLDAVDAHPEQLHALVMGQMWTLGLAARPEGELGQRFVAKCVELIDFIRVQSDSGALISVRPQGGANPARHLVLRIDRVEVDGHDAPFHVFVEDAESSATWHFVDWPFFQIRVEAPPISDSARVTITGAACYCAVSTPARSIDETCATTKDPLQWGVPVAMAPFVSTTTLAKTPTSNAWAAPTGASTGPFEIFLTHDRSAWPLPAPTLFAALPIVACALTGALVGAALVVARGAARVVSGRRPKLAPPRCPRCRSTVRGEAALLPERCSECGYAIRSGDDLMWMSEPARPILFAAASIACFAGVAALCYVLAAPLANAINAQLFRCTSSEQYGDWFARIALGEIHPRFSQQAQSMLVGGVQFVPALNEVQRMPLPFSNVEANGAAARRIMRDWRGAATLDRRAVADSGSEAASICMHRIYRSMRDGTVPEADAAPAIKDMMAVTGAPRFIVPKAVPPCSSVYVTHYEQEGRTHLFVRALTPTGAAPEPWCERPREFVAMIPVEIGEAECAFEWAIIPSNPLERGLPDGELLERELASTPLRGVVRERVRVVPRTQGVTLIDDAASNPLQPPTIVWAAIRKFGERDELSISASIYGYGVSVRGDWVIDFPTGSVTLRLLPKSSLIWSALATTPSPLPDELVARFVPRPLSDDERAAGSSIVWSGSMQVRLRRVKMPEQHGPVTLYAAEPT